MRLTNALPSTAIAVDSEELTSEWALCPTFWLSVAIREFVLAITMAFGHMAFVQLFLDCWIHLGNDQWLTILRSKALLPQGSREMRFLVHWDM